MRIGRLTLHTGPLSDAEARELAELVAEDVAGLALPPAGAMRIEIAQPGTGGVASLREAVTKAVEAALTGGARADARSPEPTGTSPGGRL